MKNEKRIETLEKIIKQEGLCIQIKCSDCRDALLVKDLTCPGGCKEASRFPFRVDLAKKILAQIQGISFEEDMEIILNQNN